MSRHRQAKDREMCHVNEGILLRHNGDPFSLQNCAQFSSIKIHFVFGRVALVANCVPLPLCPAEPAVVLENSAEL